MRSDRHGQPPIRDLAGLGVDPVQLEHPLCNIQSVCRSIHLGLYERLPFAQDSHVPTLTGWVAALYPGLLQPMLPLRPPMKSADSHLIPPASSKLCPKSRFSKSRSDLSCHHIRCPRNLQRSPCVKRYLLCRANRSCRFRAHVSFLIRSIVSQYCPDRSRHLVGQRDNHHVQRSPLLHLLDPRAGLLCIR